METMSDKLTAAQAVEEIRTARKRATERINSGDMVPLKSYRRYTDDVDEILSRVQTSEPPIPKIVFQLIEAMTREARFLEARGAQQILEIWQRSYRG